MNSVIVIGIVVMIIVFIVNILKSKSKTIDEILKFVSGTLLVIAFVFLFRSMGDHYFLEGVGEFVVAGFFFFLFIIVLILLILRKGAHYVSKEDKIEKLVVEENIKKSFKRKLRSYMLVVIIVISIFYGEMTYKYIKHSAYEIGTDIVTVYVNGENGNRSSEGDYYYVAYKDRYMEYTEEFDITKRALIEYAGNYMSASFEKEIYIIFSKGDYLNSYLTLEEAEKYIEEYKIERRIFLLISLIGFIVVGILIVKRYRKYVKEFLI